MVNFYRFDFHNHNRLRWLNRKGFSSIPRHRVKMKVEVCNFSGYKIYPGHGKRTVRTDGRVQTYMSKKTEAQADLHRNPREVRWTVLYRRKYKKGRIAEDTTKRRTHRRTGAAIRAVVGASLTEILAKRNQKPEVRKAQREEAIKAAKEKIKAERASKAPAKGKAAPKQKIRQDKAVRKMPKAAPKIGRPR